MFIVSNFDFRIFYLSSIWLFFKWKYVQLNLYQSATLYSYWVADSPSPEKLVVRKELEI